MSAGNTTDSPRYRAMFDYDTMNGYLVVERGFGLAVDRYRTISAAERAARLLNAGAASVDCHAVLGCKVVER